MMEEVRPVVGYEGYYEVTSTGKIWSIKRNKFLKPNLVSGYEQVMLFKNKAHKNHYIHRIVAEAFIENPNPEKFNQINHKDEDKRNNSVENLEWTDSKTNCNYGTRNSKIAKPVIVEDARYGKFVARFDSVKAAAAFIGVDPYVVSLCCHGTRKTTHGYKTRFERDGGKDNG